MDENKWKSDIFKQLQLRNKIQTDFFQDLVASQNKLFETSAALRNENLQLSLQNEKLRVEGLSSNTCASTSTNDTRLNERIQQLESKLLMRQEELTELHKRKGENAQQIIDLNIKVQEKDKLLMAKDVSIAEYEATVTMLRAETRMYQNSIKELENINQTIRDEHQGLQLVFTILEEKLRKTQEENQNILEQFMQYKSKDADKMNEENDKFVSDGTHNFPRLSSSFRMFRKKYAKVKKDLEDACKDVRGASMDDFHENAVPIYKCSLPSKATLKFEAHDGEVNAVTWAPDDQHVVATGGTDRKVQLWCISKGSYKHSGSLIGSNAAVMSVAFDPTGALVLGTSNDYASRVWGVGDMRLKHTLTGHSGKVMAGKFLGESSKVVTGSYDRTLKIWDLRSRACIETKFAGSSCNDLVTTEGAGATIISGHYDKRIRFWDSRSDSNANEILLQGKITSLALSRDANYLISCVRDDTLKLIDLRMNQIISSYSSDGFKVGCDWSRATLSPDSQYVAVGSSDGSVYIWGIHSTKVEAILKDEGVGLFSRSSILATAWSPFGTYLISVDRSKRAILWGDD